MPEFEDDDDFEINRPLDRRYVAVGLSMLVFGLFGSVAFENQIIRLICLFCLVASLFVMTKRERLGR